METLKATLNSAGIDPSTFALMTNDSGAGSIYTLQTTGANAIPLWKQLRGLTETTGYWPVVLGGEEEVETHRELIEDNAEERIAEVIQQGTAINAPAWFAESTIEWEAKAVEFGFSDLHGEWPNDVPASHEFDVLKMLKPGPLTLGLIPVCYCWEVPAVLGLGGWNDCPFTEVHVGLMKSWYDRFGAEIVTATDDFIEMQVARPPQTREAAIALAKEHFLYCEDIVLLVAETLENLAAALLNATVWHFWWD